MYRVFAHDLRARVNLGIRRRLAPARGNTRRRIELMNGPLVFAARHAGDLLRRRNRNGHNIYLGETATGADPDAMERRPECGLFTGQSAKTVPADHHRPGVSLRSPSMSRPSRITPARLLWWTKRLIGQRRLHKAFGRGSIEFLHPDNRRILAFIREFEDERILVVANLSRFVQYVGWIFQICGVRSC